MDILTLDQMQKLFPCETWELPLELYHANFAPESAVLSPNGVGVPCQGSFDPWQPEASWDDCMPILFQCHMNLFHSYKEDSYSLMVSREETGYSYYNTHVFMINDVSPEIVCRMALILFHKVV